MKRIQLDKSINIRFFNRNSYSPKDFHNIDCIVHVAGLAHAPEITDEKSYMDANFELTKILVDQANEFKIPHFIFISTIGVLGIKTEANNFFTDDTPYAPYNYYSRAKKLAEEYIIHNFSGKITSLRPTAAYGKGAKGNFFNILNNTVHIPLPFKGIKAQKNYIYVENLVEIIYQSIIKRPIGIFNCCDPWPVSVYEFRQEIAKAKLIRLKDFYLPNFLIKSMLFLIGKKDKIEYLFSDLRIDGNKIYQTLQLTPKYSLAEGIKKSFSPE